jgi:phenylalanyl-tRNA synthetase beta chain
VETDRGLKRVVCGGSNLQVGQLVAFAHIGARVKWHGGDEMTLEPVKIRGEASEGMICAAEELELTSAFPPLPEQGEHPVVDLTSRGLAVGASLREALGLTDTIFVFSNTAITHRPDLFSHIGFARECVALGLASWKRQPTFSLPAFPTSPQPIACEVETSAVRRYLSCLVEVDAIGQTPDWMVRRLEATGWRSVSLPVDITNYVSMEVGMPLHCFDADDIVGKVRFRLSEAGEAIVTLDGVERALPAGAVILSDDQGVFDLMGIMGGLRSSTKAGSKRLYVHSAVVDPVPIRRAMQATGHRTDAGTVYEKGIANVTAAQGFARALELIVQLVPGARIASSCAAWGDDGQATSIALPIARIESFLGFSVPSADVVRGLEALGFAVTQAGDTWQVTPPLFRADVRTTWDILEEIARLYGYDRMPMISPRAPMKAPVCATVSLHRLRDLLRAAGFWEQVPLSLTSPDVVRRAAFDPASCEQIVDPLGVETSLIQPSPLPQLLQHASERLAKRAQPFQTMQSGHSAQVGKGEWPEMALLWGDPHVRQVRDLPALRLARVLHEVAGDAHLPLELAPASMALPGWAHPGRVQALSFAGEVIGLVAELHPTVCEAFRLPPRTAAATLRLERVLGFSPAPQAFRMLSLFPSITYDVTVRTAAHDDHVAALRRLQGADPLLSAVEVVDVYGDLATPDDLRVTLRLHYQADDRTLTEAEVKPVHERLVGSVLQLPVA